jgi:hypothetical protein
MNSYTRKIATLGTLATADVRNNQIDKSVTAFRQRIVTVTYPEALHRQKFIHPRVSVTVDAVWTHVIT